MNNIKTSNVKKILAFQFLFFTLFSSAQTSVYHPFPEANAFWNCVYVYGDGICQDELYYSTIIGADTNINGVSYHTLQTPEVIDVYAPSCNLISSGYKGCYRQDTSLRKVYFIPPGQNTEMLLYDFDPNIGDTVMEWQNSGIGCLGVFVVNSVDSVFVGGNYRKAWRGGGANQFLIEGIGTTYGVISPACNLFEGQYSLLCYKQDSVIYPDGSLGCDPLDDVNSPKLKSSILITPNPVKYMARITINDPDFIGCDFMLYNSNGALVSCKKIAGFQTTLLRENLVTGVYFYRIGNFTGEKMSGIVIID